MKHLASQTAAVLLLMVSNAGLSADSSYRFADIGGFDAAQALCRVTISPLNRHWRVNLGCGTPTEMSGAVSVKLEAASLWLLLDEGKAAIPFEGTRVGVGTCGLGCQMNLSTEFEIPEHPSAVVVKYEDTFHVLPITKEHRIKMSAQ